MEPEAQDALFNSSSVFHKPVEEIPEKLRASANRLEFPPSYVVVGIYRLFTDKALYVPAWDKCRHGARRGLIVGTIWALLTFGIQRKFVELFLSNSPRVTGLSNETIFGYKPPFSLTTYASFLLLGSQVTYILRFFLARNIRIARERAWGYTLLSRGKGSDFWQPYVEEWEHPPAIDTKKKGFLQTLTSSSAGLFITRRIIFISFSFYPLIGIFASAWIKALGMARYLHKPYFESKKMTPEQIAIFVAERKWSYRAFGFAAALVEGLPIIGLVFSVSNRVGAAMWAHDLEKRQHYVRIEKASVKGTKSG